MSLVLVIGNKTYSSWSLRPWLAARHAGLAFREINVPLDTPDTQPLIRTWSPAGKVPCLADGTVRVWDSLAIIEYLAEKAPTLWPADAALRAEARSISAEMHAGFQAMRGHLPINLQRPPATRALTPAVEKDITRVQAIWTSCRERFASAGPWLFGTFSAADAMFAPVATRFRTYGVPMPSLVAAYVDTVYADPHFRAWQADAFTETQVLAVDEVDWPQAPRMKAPA
jgi:glutathione S-transferase